ncbi:hypothetical protein SLS64_011363 [Diaporthe eres]|uniref:Uncharacterized protein n=1 Tax=Diaporthe eres TaxID=83184 RepID=A0ABR1NMA7_DIAER
MIPELQARLDKDPALSNLCVLGVDPGSTPSGITRRGGWVIHVFIGQFVMLIMAHVFSWLFANAAVRTNEKAGKDLLAAMLQCNANLGKRPKGLYLDGDVVVELGAEARDRNKTGILWRDTLRYTGLRPEDTCLASL